MNNPDTDLKNRFGNINTNNFDRIHVVSLPDNVISKIMALAGYLGRGVHHITTIVTDQVHGDTWGKMVVPDEVKPGIR